MTVPIDYEFSTFYKPQAVSQLVPDFIHVPFGRGALSEVDTKEIIMIDTKRLIKLRVNKFGVAGAAAGGVIDTYRLVKLVHYAAAPIYAALAVVREAGLKARGVNILSKRVFVTLANLRKDALWIGKYALLKGKDALLKVGTTKDALLIGGAALGFTLTGVALGSVSGVLYTAGEKVSIYLSPDVLAKMLREREVAEALNEFLDDTRFVEQNDAKEIMCGITRSFYTYPMVVECCKESFDKEALANHVKNQIREKLPSTCPACRKPLTVEKVRYSYAVACQVNEFIKAVINRLQNVCDEKKFSDLPKKIQDGDPNKILSKLKKCAELINSQYKIIFDLILLKLKEGQSVKRGDLVDCENGLNELTDWMDRMVIKI